MAKQVRLKLGAPLKDVTQSALEVIKRKAVLVKLASPSDNMRARAIKIYELAKELQEDFRK